MISKNILLILFTVPLIKAHAGGHRGKHWGKHWSSIWGSGSKDILHKESDFADILLDRLQNRWDMGHLINDTSCMVDIESIMDQIEELDFELDLSLLRGFEIDNRLSDGMIGANDHTCTGTLAGQPFTRFSAIFFEDYTTTGGQDILGPLAVGGKFDVKSYTINANHGVGTCKNTKDSLSTYGLVVGGSVAGDDIHVKGAVFVPPETDESKIDLLDKDCEIISNATAGAFNFEQVYTNSAHNNVYLSGLEPTLLLDAEGRLSRIRESETEYDVLSFATCNGGDCELYADEMSVPNQMLYGIGNWNGPQGMNFPSNLILNIPVDVDSNIVLAGNQPTFGLTPCSTIWNFYPSNANGKYTLGQFSIYRRTSGQLGGLILAPEANIFDGSTGNFAGLTIGRNYRWEFDHGVEVHDYHSVGGSCKGFTGCLPLNNVAWPDYIEVEEPIVLTVTNLPPVDETTSSSIESSSSSEENSNQCSISESSQESSEISSESSESSTETITHPSLCTTASSSTYTPTYTFTIPGEGEETACTEIDEDDHDDYKHDYHKYKHHDDDQGGYDDCDDYHDNKHSHSHKYEHEHGHEHDNHNDNDYNHYNKHKSHKNKEKHDKDHKNHDDGHGKSKFVHKPKDELAGVLQGAAYSPASEEEGGMASIPENRDSSNHAPSQSVGRSSVSNIKKNSAATSTVQSGQSKLSPNFGGYFSTFTFIFLLRYIFS